MHIGTDCQSKEGERRRRRRRDRRRKLGVVTVVVVVVVVDGSKARCMNIWQLSSFQPLLIPPPPPPTSLVYTGNTSVTAQICKYIHQIVLRAPHLSAVKTTSSDLFLIPHPFYTLYSILLYLLSLHILFYSFTLLFFFYIF